MKSPKKAGSQDPLRLVIAGGGTGGHVQPAVAVLQELRRRQIPLELLWIGSRNGTERDAATSENVPFRAINTGKFRRYFSFRTPFDAALVLSGIVQAYPILREFKPDIIFGTGGYVSSAGVIGGARLAPVLIHEQTAVLGFATRLNQWFANVLALSFPSSESLAHGFRCKIVVTGNPTRNSLLEGEAARAFQHFDFDPTLPLLYVTGGARGASPINTRIEAILSELLEEMQIVHQTGDATANDDGRRLQALRDTMPARLQKRYVVRDFIGPELADLYAASTLIVCRSGAGTVAELALLGKPSIMIPLPNTGGDEQTKNAMALANNGAAIALPETEATPERLLAEIHTLLADQPRRESMAARAKQQGRPAAAATLVDELLKLAGRL